MKKLLSLAFIALFCFSGLESFATHVAGGEISYKYIGSPVNPHRYDVTLILIRDSRGTTLGNNASIQYTSSCFGGGSISATLQAGSGVGLQTFAQNSGYSNPFACVQSSAAGGLDPNTYEIYIYKTTVNLPGKCNDWRFSYSLCCRNGAIANLTNPSSYNFYIDAILNNNLGPNSSPVFTDPPARAFCTGGAAGLPRPLVWNQRSTELDGDSTLYSFGQPQSAFNTNIAFAPGYTRNQPMKTVNGITFLNQSRGIMSLSPNAPGQEDNVVKLDIEEYRFDSISGFWLNVGRVSREVTVPIVQQCNDSTQAGLSVDLGQPGVTPGSMSADTLFFKYGIDTTFINKTGNPSSNSGGQRIYDIPIVNYNCFDSVINLTFDFEFECSSLSPNASEFRLVGPDSVARPIIGSYTPRCGLNAQVNEEFDKEISLLLHRKLDKDGYYILQIRKGFDGNVLTNSCGYTLESGYTIIINVQNCPTIEYNMENVTVQGDTIVKMNWAVDEPIGPYIRQDLFESWDVRRVNNGNEYLIGRIYDMNARTFYDHTLKPEQLDYESFAYTVQLVQNKRYHLPANYISTILLKAAVGKVASRQYEMRLLWSPYNGFDTTAYYQLELAELNPDSSIISWSPYKNLAPNYQENTYLIDQSDVNNEGLFAFRVVASDEIAPFSPYISHSNYVYFQNKYEDIPDTTLVTVRAPNTFTPNEDGYNDRFFIEGINGNKEYREVSVTVYNRWGQKVFEDENFAARNNAIEGWDGTDMTTGQKLSDGVYYYFIEMFDPGTQTKQDIKGSVTLLGGTN